MVMWEVFRRKARAPQKVTTGRCEIKRNGEVAFLEYSLAGNIVELNHTEVPVFGVRVRCAEAVNSLPLGSLARDADCVQQVNSGLIWDASLLPHSTTSREICGGPSH